MLPDNIQILNKHHFVNKDTFHVINGIYIGRGKIENQSLLGNPYSHLFSPDSENYEPTREGAVERYKIYAEHMLKNNLEYRSNIMDLVKKYINGEQIKLICWCAPSPCHGEVIKEMIIELANKILSK